MGISERIQTSDASYFLSNGSRPVCFLFYSIIRFPSPIITIHSILVVVICLLFNII